LRQSPSFADLVHLKNAAGPRHAITIGQTTTSKCT